MKKETGVMVMKNGKAWAKTYDDGHSSSYGWVVPEEGEIHNPKFCVNPTDVTYERSPYFEDLKSAKVVMVERVISVKEI